MILNSQSLSNDSESFNDYRYQKALKEISKLINVNREIKIESQRCRNQYLQISQRNTNLLEMNTTLQNQNVLLKQELHEMTVKYSQLEDSWRRAQSEQKELLKSNQIESKYNIQIKKKHQQEIQELQQHFRQQMNQMMVEINQKTNAMKEMELKLNYINELEAENDKLHQKYEVLINENEQLNKKIKDLNEKLLTVQSKIKPEPNEDLLNKMKINEEWIKSLNQENYMLKQKLFEEQYKKERQKCNQTIMQNLNNNNKTTPLFTKDLISIDQFKSYNQPNLANNPLGVNTLSTTTNQLLIKQYLKTQISKRVKKIQEEKHKIQSKYNKLKAKYNQLQVKQKSMSKEINLLAIKLSGYEQLAERQQREIELMVVEYHKEMDRLMGGKQIKAKKHHHQYQNQPSKHGIIKALQQYECQHDPSSTSINNNLLAVTELTNRQNQLKQVILSLQQEIVQNKAQSDQREKLITFLQSKIESLEEEKYQLKQINYQLENELVMQQKQKNDMDLSKTSKNYHRSQSLLKTHSIPGKNGGKVYVINGKQYETKLLKGNKNDNNSNRINTNKNDISSSKKQEGRKGEKYNEGMNKQQDCDSLEQLGSMQDKAIEVNVNEHNISNSKDDIKQSSSRMYPHKEVRYSHGGGRNYSNMVRSGDTVGMIVKQAS